MTDEKNPQQAKIHKGSPKRDPVSYQTTRDIIIPAGTILRHDGDDKYAAEIYPRGKFFVTAKPGAEDNAFFKRVIAA